MYAAQNKAASPWGGRSGSELQTQKNNNPAHKSEQGIDVLLSRLDGIRKTGQDRWMARCPAHGDKTASLSIRDDQGKILLRCFAGCSVHEVVAAVGMNLADLFPPRAAEPWQTCKPFKRPFDALGALQALSDDALVVALCASALARGEAIAGSDRQRLLDSVSRIQNALDACGGAR